MRELTQEENRLVDYFFSLPEIKARRIAATPKNTALMEAFVDEHMIQVINIAALTWMVNQLAPKLDYLAGADLSSQLQAGAVAAAQLAETQREKDRQATAERKRLENIARLESQGSRGNHGFATADDIAAENVRIQREAKEREKAITRMQRHEQFTAELKAANQHLETNFNGIMWGKTNDMRARLKAALKQKYPEFASEAV